LVLKQKKNVCGETRTGGRIDLEAILQIKEGRKV
jgi:hypothetical protein